MVSWLLKLGLGKLWDGQSGGQKRDWGCGVEVEFVNMLER